MTIEEHIEETLNKFAKEEKRRKHFIKMQKLYKRKGER